MVITGNNEEDVFSIVQWCPYSPLIPDEYAPIKKKKETKIKM